MTAEEMEDDDETLLEMIRMFQQAIKDESETDVASAELIAKLVVAEKKLAEAVTALGGMEKGIGKTVASEVSKIAPAVSATGDKLSTAMDSRLKRIEAQAEKLPELVRLVAEIGKGLTTAVKDEATRREQLLTALVGVSQVLDRAIENDRTLAQAVKKLNGAMESVAAAVKESAKPRKRTIKVNRGEDDLMESLTVTES